MYHGDIRLGDTIDIKFTTVNTSDVPTTLAGTPVVSAYPGDSLVEITAGITLTVDFDARTGLHNVRVVASGTNGFATATSYVLVITTGTVGGSSVVGYVIGSFSIEARSAVMPTTAGRTLNIAAGGEAGIDLDNTVGTLAKGTDLTGFNDLDAAGVRSAVGLGAASLDTQLSGIQADTDDLQVRLSYLRRGTAQAGAAGTITLDSGASATDDLYNGLVLGIIAGAGVGQARLVSDYVGATKVASITPSWITNPDATSVFVLFPAGRVDVALWLGVAPNALAGGRVDAEVGTAGFAQGAADKAWSSATRTLTAFGFSVTVGTNNDKTGYELSAAGIQAIWDRLTSALTTVGSIGRLLVDNINATISSRATPADVPTAAVTADAVWDEASAGHVGVGSTGERIERLDLLLTGGAGELTPARASLLANLDALITSRATPAQVNAEVLDVLNVDTFAEPGQEAPGATVSLVRKIGYLYKLLRNRVTSSATQVSVYGDDATTIHHKATHSDDGTTYDRGEFGTGP